MVVAEYQPPGCVRPSLPSVKWRRSYLFPREVAPEALSDDSRLLREKVASMLITVALAFFYIALVASFLSMFVIYQMLTAVTASLLDIEKRIAMLEQETLPDNRLDKCAEMLAAYTSL